MRPTTRITGAWTAAKDVNQNWVAESRTKLQVQLDGGDVKYWPEPCENCGANWKQTVKGRFWISHFAHGVIPMGPTLVVDARLRVSEPTRIAALIPPVVVPTLEAV